MNLFCSAIKSCLGAVASFLAGEVCISCGEAGGFLCSRCMDGLPWSGYERCMRCGSAIDGVVTDGAECGQCLTDPPDFVRACVPFRYEGVLRTILAEAKFGGKYYFYSRLMKMLDARERDILGILRGASCIVPVALSRSRLFARGYNQSLIISRELSRRLDIPICNDILRRDRDGVPQSSLPRSERFRNVKNTFSLRKKVDFDRVVLVDDIITTTATIREAAGVLRKGGVHEVYVFALCRTDD